MAAQNVENPGEHIIGLHTGEAINEGEDLFGKTVTLAARIVSQAKGEQTLVSSLLKALVESSDSGREVTCVAIRQRSKRTRFCVCSYSVLERCGQSS